MSNFIRAYLRASTDEQNAERAKESLINFVEDSGLKICSFYIENESGAKLERPELMRLLNDCSDGDVLLVEDIDRLSRLDNKDWQLLKKMIREKNVKIVALNVPTTHQVFSKDSDSFENRVFTAINEMLIEMLTAVARRDYIQRRERQKQGIKNAKRKGKFKGRKVDYDKYESIIKLRKAGHTYKEIHKLLGSSSRTIRKAIEWHNNKEDKYKQIINLVEKGKTEYQITQLLDVSSETVSQAIKWNKNQLK